MQKLFLYPLVLAAIFTGCTANREVSFPQGAGENLLEVSAFDGKTFEIKTSSAISNQKVGFSNAEELTSDADKVGISNYQVVNYTVSDEFARKHLAETPILGKANHTYGGLIKVNDQYLVLYKVGTKNDLPLIEQSSALKLDGGRLAVPLIGYSIIGKYTIERQKDQNNQSTSRLLEKPQPTLAQATHFRIDVASGQIFETATKIDVFPVEFFDGEWFFTSTTVSAPEVKADEIGDSQNHDSNFKDSNRIKFIANENTLSAVNLNLDARLAEKSADNFTRTLSIPITRLAFRIANQGRAMMEEVDPKTHWKERPLLQLRLNETVYSDRTGLRLVGLKITNDYFSYTVEDQQSVRVKHAFMRTKPSSYVGKRLFRSDFLKFGFFTTFRNVAITYELFRTEDIEKNVNISRFDPKKEIVYRFSKTSPQWIRPAVRAGFDAWGKAFQKAGTSIKLRLDESSDVELGDIRYNIVNIIEPLGGSNSLGYGPSLQDPKSGEIITATTNVNITSMKDIVIEGIRDFIAVQRGEFKNSSVVGISAQLQALTRLITNKNGDSRKFINQLVNREITWNDYVAEGGSFVKKQVVSFANGNRPFNFDKTYSIAFKNLSGEITDSCPDVLAFVERTKDKPNESSTEENQILLECAKKLVVPRFLATLVHELGHNFGLRHNFMGSVDSENFWKKEDTNTSDQIRMSSVMDYATGDEKNMVLPGKYDIAAIRFGYADTIELENGELLKLDTNKSIDDNLKTKGLSRKNYLFCTDENTFIGTSALCRRWDSGTTPLEIVQQNIAEYNALVESTLYRGSRISNPGAMRLAIFKASKHLDTMAQIYEEWRLLLARFIGPQDRYLERFDEKSFEEKINDLMSKNPKFKQQVELYRPAVEQIFEFFVTVMQTENRYCATAPILKAQNQNSMVSPLQLSLQELHKLRPLAHARGVVRIESCRDLEDTYFKQEGRTLVADIGTDLFESRFETDALKNMVPFNYSLSGRLDTPVDGIGFFWDRFLASTMLTQRISSLYESRTSVFSPSFLDEPRYRREYLSILMDRMVNGISLQRIRPLLKVEAEKEKSAEKLALLKNSLTGNEKHYFTKFEAEKELLAGNFLRGIENLVVPGNSETIRRLETFQVHVLRPGEQSLAEKAPAVAQLPNGATVIARSEKAVNAIALLRRYSDLQRLKSLTAINLEDSKVKEVVEAIVGYYPETAEVDKRTIGNLFELEQFFGSLVQKHGQAAVGPFVTIFAAEFNLLQQFKNFENSSVPAEQREEFRKMSLNAFLQSNKLPPVTIDRTIVLAEMKKIVSTNNAEFEFYQREKGEFEAQADLLARIISVLASI